MAIIHWVDIKHEIGLIIIVSRKVVLRLHKDVTVKGIFSDLINHLAHYATIKLVECLGLEVGFLFFCRFDV